MLTFLRGSIGAVAASTLQCFPHGQPFLILVAQLQRRTIRKDIAFARCGARIDAGQQQLDGAGAELGEGYEQLHDAERQLDEGRQTLEENRQKLQEELKELDRYSSDEERLAAGMDLLLQVPEISALAGRSSTYAEICAAAERWLNEQIDSAREEALWSRLVFLLGAAGLLSLISLLLWVMKKLLPCSAILAGLSALLALAAAGLWKAMCPSLTALPFIAAVALLILSGTAVDLIARHSIKPVKA